MRAQGSVEVISRAQATTARRETAERLRQATELLKQTLFVNLSPLLPLLLNLKGEPYTLRNHFPFEPLFNTRMPRSTLLKAARQTAKSSSFAAKGIVSSVCIPYLSTLYVTPLYEMIRRFSNNYVRPFIEQSPVKSLWMGTDTENSVLQRTFKNHSKMIFSFAFLDAERTRGISADRLAVDEYQDMDSDFLPIMKETMSASKWSMTELAGTPKTLDNGMETAWLRSSQAEWVIPCQGCHYDNIPTLTHDLDAMIGEDVEDLSEAKPGIICARCRRPIFPRQGRWIHNHPERRFEFVGYHVPQIIMPMHYADCDKWKILLGKRKGLGNTPLNVFYNEVCGESYDMGARLVTVTDLKQAASLHENNLEAAETKIENYTHRVLAVDWGGGGEKGVSFTTVAILGLLPTGKVECIYGWRSLTPHDHLQEAERVVALCHKFRCSHVVHDYSGAGEGRHLFMVHSGFPAERIIACAYVRAASSGIMRHIPATENHPRDHYRIDKARSLVLTCQLIKHGFLTFFKYDYESDDNRGLLHDFLALVEDKVDSRTGCDIYTVIRNEKMTDDFAQAVNIGCMALFYMSGHWPQMSEVISMQADLDILRQSGPIDRPDWNDDLGFRSAF